MLSPIPSPRLLGVHQDLMYFGSSNQAKKILLAQALNAKISRSTLLWDSIQTAADTYSWTSADAIVDGLIAGGIQPLLCPMRFPSWISGYSDWNVVPSSSSDWGDARDAYAEFCGTAAARYKGRVKHWEIWNEPNEHFFWSYGSDDSDDRDTARERYAEMYLAARDAILAEIPDAYVSVGGITGLNASGDPPGSGNQWLADFLDMASITPSVVSHVAIHPYTANFTEDPDDETPFQPHFSDIGLIRDTLDSNGFDSTELWVTEWGWKSTSPLTEELQATYVSRSLERLRDDFPYVMVATYFLDADMDIYDYGLYESDLTTAKESAASFLEGLRGEVSMNSLLQEGGDVLLREEDGTSSILLETASGGGGSSKPSRLGLLGVSTLCLFVLSSLLT